MQKILVLPADKGDKYYELEKPYESIEKETACIGCKYFYEGCSTYGDYPSCYRSDYDDTEEIPCLQLVESTFKSYESIVRMQEQNMFGKTIFLKYEDAVEKLCEIRERFNCNIKQGDAVYVLTDEAVVPMTVVEINELGTIVEKKKYTILMNNGARMKYANFADFNRTLFLTEDDAVKKLNS